MSRFIVLAFPKHSLQRITEEGPMKGRMIRNRVRRVPFGNNEVGANAYCKLMHEKNKQNYHVIDQHLKATTFRV